MTSTDQRHYTWALALTLGVAFLIRMFVAYTMPNILWPDEIYQSMEQAHRVVFGYGITPWEFRDGTRSWIIPGLLAVVMKVTSWVTSSTTAYLMTCAAALSLISLAPVWASFRLAYREVGLRGAVVAGAAAALWFELIYFAPKALSEAVAGNCLALGSVLAMHCTRDDDPPTRRRVIAFAAALALASMLRIQLSIAAFAVFVIVTLKLPRNLKLAAVIAGGAVVLGAGILDWITWSYPFQSYIENVRINIVEDKSSIYGIAPWYAYFDVYWQIWGVWLLPILGLAVVGARRARLLAIGAGLVLLAHVPIAHKEYRFAYPAMLLIIMLAGLGMATVVKIVEDRRGARSGTLAAMGCIALWLAASISGAKGYDANKTQLANVWAKEQSHWERRVGGLEALRQVAEQPSICGVGLLGVGWGDTGGYTYLHRNIPIYPFRSKEAVQEYLPHFNAILLRTDRGETFGPYVRIQCWPDLCLYVRPGDCVVLHGFDTNAVIEMLGQ